MYFALVRPILDYASVVCDQHTTSDIQRLEMIQRRAAQFVINNYKRTEGTVTDILSKLEWPSLQQRRKESRLVVMYKIQHQDIAVPIPEYIRRQTSHVLANIILQVSCGHLPMCTNSVSFHAPSQIGTNYHHPSLSQVS